METKTKTFDLVGLGDWLKQNSLMEKPFSTFTKDQIENLCKAVHLATIPVEFRVPYLKNHELIMPMPCHPRFAYWAEGQTLFKTLKEMGADPEVIERYCPPKDNGNLKPKTAA